MKYPKGSGWIRLDKRLLPAAAMVFLTPAMLVAQTPDGTPASRKTPHFEYSVAVIRLSKEGNDNWSINNSSDTLSAQNASVKALLAEAYSIREDLISGEPAWANSDHYDIRAKILDADPDALKKLTDADHRVMLQALLVERFHLRVHTETKTLPVYDLIQAKSGLKLPEVTSAPKPGATMEADSFRGISRGSMSTHFSGSEAELLGHAVTTEQVAFVLAYQVRRTVIDKTGLTGHYDVAFTWAPDSGIGPLPDATAPPIFTAL